MPGPRIAGEAEANPGEPCQDLGQSVLDMSLCAIAWVKLLVKPKENHGLRALVFLARSTGFLRISLSEIYLK